MRSALGRFYALSTSLRALGCGVLACSALGCPSPAPVPPPVPPKPSATAATPKPPSNPLELPKSAPELQSPALRDKLTASPHNYFRAVNRQFAQEVCRRFKPVMATLPMVNLHGDAHVEQFAVTAHSVGLSDFDDSVTGPAVIDLVRFGTSIVLTARQRGWPSAELLQAFFDSYSASLGGGEQSAYPAVVERIRNGFKDSRSTFLSWAEGRMQPPPADRKPEVERGYERYTKLMLQLNPDKDEAFFKLKVWGMLRGDGIGSAISKRYLARIEGPSPDPEDDVILEAKEVRDMSPVKCVEARRGDALRVVAGSVRFGQRPDPFLAIVPRGPEESDRDMPWWIQSWSASYAELDIHQSLQSEQELREVVTLIGHQMARGHANLLPPPLDKQLRTLIAQMLSERRQAIGQVVGELSELVLQAHAAVKRRSAAQPASPQPSSSPAP